MAALALRGAGAEAEAVVMLMQNEENGKRGESLELAMATFGLGVEKTQVRMEVADMMEDLPI